MHNSKIFIYSFICSLCFASLSFAKSIHPPAAAVVSTSDAATNAGISILKQGGNAFDAAVAVAATLAVTEPYHSGIGGGGFWLLHTAKDNRDYFIDARETAPARLPAAHVDEHRRAASWSERTGETGRGAKQVAGHGHETFDLDV